MTSAAVGLRHNPWRPKEWKSMDTHKEGVHRYSTNPLAIRSAHLLCLDWKPLAEPLEQHQADSLPQCRVNAVAFWRLVLHRLCTLHVCLSSVLPTTRAHIIDHSNSTFIMKQSGFRRYNTPWYILPHLVRTNVTLVGIFSGNVSRSTCVIRFAPCRGKEQVDATWRR